MLKTPDTSSSEIDELQAKLALLDAEIHARDVLIAKLKHQLAGMRRHRFGCSSEGLDQLNLMLEAEEIAIAADQPVDQPEEPVTQKDKPRRKPLPDHLPRDEQILEAGEACLSCGGKLKPLGEDVTEELEYVPGRFRVVGGHCRVISSQRCSPGERSRYNNHRPHSALDWATPNEFASSCSGLTRNRMDKVA